MRLIFRRSQKILTSGLMKKKETQLFILKVVGDASEEELSNAKKYGMDDKHFCAIHFPERKEWISISIYNLADGHVIESDNIVEITNIEIEIKQKFLDHVNKLEMAVNFGGEEIIEA